MTWRVHKHIGTCSAPVYNFPGGTRHLLSKNRERACIAEDSGEDKSESEESESLGLQLEFEITNFALNYIRALGIFQRTRTTKYTAKISVVQRIIHLLAVGSVVGEDTRSQELQMARKYFYESLVVEKWDKEYFMRPSGRTSFALVRKNDSLVSRWLIREMRGCWHRGRSRWNGQGPFLPSYPL